MELDQTEAVRRFYEEHRQELYTYALMVTHCSSKAEDAIHSAFSGLLKRRSLPDDLRPYVFRSVRNAAIDELRANHRPPDSADVFATRPNDPSEDAARSDTVRHLLAALNDDERECVILKALNGLTFKEIGAIRRVSINTAASWYRRAMDKMRDAEEKLR